MTRLTLSGLTACAALASSPVPGAADTISAPAINATVAHALATRLPHTHVDAIDCTRVTALCEVDAGPNVFYVDPAARYLVVGRIYDMVTRQDLTAARLLAVNPDALVTRAATEGSENATSTQAHDPGSPSQQVSLASLPASGAIPWGGDPAGPPAITVFSDFHCGYCRMLHQTLKDMGLRVAERPISVLGTRALSEAVLCAPDPAAAVERAYGDADVPRRTCDTSGLDANERFARERGFSGTPVLVRRDGAIVLGLRPRAFLDAWLKGGA